MTDFTAPLRSQRDLGWHIIRDALAERTKTPYGREQAQNLEFLPSISAVCQSLGRIAEVRALLKDGVRLPVGAPNDVRPSISRAAKRAVLSAHEILHCAHLMHDAARLHQFARGRQSVLPCVGPLLEAFVCHSELAADIDYAIDASGNVRDEASQALKQARSRVQQLQRQLAERIEVFLHDPAFASYLQDQYFSVREDRYVLPIIVQARNHVPGIVHNTSNTGLTVFIEPAELIPLGNELALQLAAVRQEERRILQMFSAAIGEHAQTLRDSTKQIGQLDTILAAALLAEHTNAYSPHVVSASERLDLIDVRHPRLALQRDKVVANRLCLPQGAQALVISGPNAGGKTVSLTSAGLCALMVRAGLQIPAAPHSRVPLYDGVYCAIGDAQDLQAGLSSFSAHLTVLNDLLRQAQQGWLVLVDEIGADTDPQEGSALAQASLEALVQAGAHVLVTTHFDAIKALGVVDKRFANAKVGFDAETLKPTFALEMGLAGVSCAFDLAEQLGLPDGVLKVAKMHLHRRGAVSEALAKLAATQSDVEAQRHKLASELQQVAEERRILALEKQQLTQARRDVQSEIYESLAAEIEAARAEIRAQLTTWRKAPVRSASDRLEAQLAGAAQKMRRNAGWVTRTPSEPTAEDSLSPGVWVRITSLGQKGQIERVDGDRLVVRIGALKSRVQRDAVVPVRMPQPIDKDVRAHEKSQKPPTQAHAGALQHSTGRCDVRGMRIDEAMRVIERALDMCLSEGAAALWIVHGLGTGALKGGVYAYLSDCAYVESVRAAQPHEGGEALSIVTLRP